MSDIGSRVFIQLLFWVSGLEGLDGNGNGYGSFCNLDLDLVIGFNIPKYRKVWIRSSKEED